MDDLVKMLEGQSLRIVETAVVIILYIFLRWLFSKIVKSHLSRRLLHETRGMAVRKIFRLVLLIISIVFILIIWGVNQTDLALFLGSALAVVGVAFFAQWSILSNVTSSIILFFGHPVKLNDEIVILEAKDYEIEGKVKDIGLFFITLETPDGEDVTLPNNIFISKSIKSKAQENVDEVSSEEEYHD